jgi:hypothetical protein
LALTSPTCGGQLAGIVRSRTKVTEWSDTCSSISTHKHSVNYPAVLISVPVTLGSFHVKRKKKHTVTNSPIRSKFFLRL